MSAASDLARSIREAVPAFTGSTERVELAEIGLREAELGERIRRGRLQDRLTEQKLETGEFALGDLRRKEADLRSPFLMSDFTDRFFRSQQIASLEPGSPAQAKLNIKTKEWMAGLIPKIGTIFGATYNPETRQYMVDATGQPLTKREFLGKQNLVAGMIAVNTNPETKINNLSEAGVEKARDFQGKIAQNRGEYLRGVLDRKQTQLERMIQFGGFNDKAMAAARKGLADTEKVFISSLLTQADKDKEKRAIMKYNLEVENLLLKKQKIGTELDAGDKLERKRVGGLLNKAKNQLDAVSGGDQKAIEDYILTFGLPDMTEEQQKDPKQVQLAITGQLRGQVNELQGEFNVIGQRAGVRAQFPSRQRVAPTGRAALREPPPDVTGPTEEPDFGRGRPAPAPSRTITEAEIGRIGTDPARPNEFFIVTPTGLQAIPMEGRVVQSFLNKTAPENIRALKGIVKKGMGAVKRFIEKEAQKFKRFEESKRITFPGR